MHDHKLPEYKIEAISRLTLALYAGASGDHNPAHIDLDVARKSGFDDVFAHGMLVMAYLGRAICSWFSQESLREFDVRFCSITDLGDEITCRGTIVDRVDVDGTSCAKVDIVAVDAKGEIKLNGYALVTN